MKRVFAFVLAMVMIVTASPLVFASDYGNDEEYYFICYSETGEILYYNMPYDILDKTRAEDGTYLKSTFLHSGHATDVDMGYHPATNIWRNVASYTFSESFTVSMSATVNWNEISYSGSLGVSAGTSWGFSFTINADQTRESKIRVYCDFDYEIYHGEVRDIYTDELYNSFEYATFTKTAEEFRVVYND